MKTLRIQCMLALAASLAATAQPPRRDDRRPPQIPPFLALFDTDHDRVLSAEEIKAASETLGKMDKNGDGQITPDEFQPPRSDNRNDRRTNNAESPPPARPPVPPVIAALDTDKDGSLSAAELEAAPESLKALDEDGDGALSPKELRPHGPPPPPADPAAE